jgi:branched-chain amino acid aminotransferase
MNSVCLDGKIIRGTVPVLAADNRGYRYGDGLFETMKLVNDKIQLEAYHFERLQHGMDILEFENSLRPGIPGMTQSILSLCKTNKCAHLARIRLSLFRGHGGLYDHDEKLHYLVECVPLPTTANDLNENGLAIDIFPSARKSCDNFSSIKSSSCLPYVMAAHYAKQNGLDDCLLLNTSGAIADSTIANLFVVMGNQIITPGLSEGCVAGVMRRQLLMILQQSRHWEVEERPVQIGDLLTAKEVFLTNAINSVRWVKQFRDKQYDNTVSTQIYKLLISSFSYFA